MAHITLRIFFFGLIAFVPTEKSLTVLLVNALRDLPITSDECPFHIHSPRLALLPENSPGCIRGSDPDFPEVCTWNLDRIRIGLPDPASQEALVYVRQLRRRTFFQKHKLPEVDSEGPDFSWIPSIRDAQGAGGRIDPRAIDNPPSPAVIARIDLDRGTVRSAHLAETGSGNLDSVVRSCDGSKTVNLFEFRSLNERQGSFRQALADGVVVETSMTGGGGLTLSPLDGGLPLNLEIKPTPCLDREGLCVDIAILNMPAHDIECSSVGVDFALLFGVALDRPAIRERRIPFRLADCVNAGTAQPSQSSALIDEIFAAEPPSPDSRPICPMATFEK